MPVIELGEEQGQQVREVAPLYWKPPRVALIQTKVVVKGQARWEHYLLNLIAKKVARNLGRLQISIFLGGDVEAEQELAFELILETQQPPDNPEGQMAI